MGTEWQLIVGPKTMVLDHNREMPHYTIKDLLFSTVLIASGIMGLIAIERWLPVATTGLQAIPLLLLYHASFVLIGTGVMLPFKKVTLGISIGIALAIVSMPFFIADR